jgi:AcrR family transcriptional regulator
VSAAARSRRRPKPDKGVTETRARLLAAGLELFAEQGFRHVTVRDIAQHAGANLAAIGYHFGDKLGLYTEIVEGAIVAMREMTDSSFGAAGELAPEDQLRRHIHAFITRAARPSGRTALLQQLMRHEMLDPTPLAQRVIDEGILPRLRALSQIVARMLDCPLTDPRVRPCVMCVQAQCLSFVRDRFRSIVISDWPAQDEAGLLRDAALVAEFSVAGIRGMAVQVAGRMQRARRKA